VPKPHSSRFIQPNAASIGLAVQTGDAFYDKAHKVFTPLTTIPMDVAQQRVIRKLGLFVSAATDLSLSIEIYLKAALLGSGIPAPHTHELGKLYEALPANARHSFESNYDALNQYDKPLTAAVEVWVNCPPPTDSKKRPKEDMTVLAILTRNADAFKVWRYLFAQPETIPNAPLTFDFLRMMLVGQAVRAAFGGDPVLEGLGSP
jgi:hypothetical protein